MLFFFKDKCKLNETMTKHLALAFYILVIQSKAMKTQNYVLVQDEESTVTSPACFTSVNFFHQDMLDN